MKDITRSFAAIEDELRSQYVVSYKPADFDSDGRYRSIQISSLKKDLQVRARRDTSRHSSKHEPAPDFHTSRLQSHLHE